MLATTDIISKVTQILLGLFELVSLVPVELVRVLLHDTQKFSRGLANLVVLPWGRLQKFLALLDVVVMGELIVVHGRQRSVNGCRFISGWLLHHCLFDHLRVLLPQVLQLRNLVEMNIVIELGRISTWLGRLPEMRVLWWTSAALGGVRVLQEDHVVVVGVASLSDLVGHLVVEHVHLLHH